MANFVQLSDVTDWVNEYPDEGVAHLRHALAIGSFQGANALMARSWMEKHDREERDAAEKEMRAYAKTSASAAWWSAATAFVAMVAAIASVVVAWLAYVKS